MSCLRRRTWSRLRCFYNLHPHRETFFKNLLPSIFSSIKYFLAGFRQFWLNIYTFPGGMYFGAYGSSTAEYVCWLTHASLTVLDVHYDFQFRLTFFQAPVLHFIIGLLECVTSWYCGLNLSKPNHFRRSHCPAEEHWCSNDEWSLNVERWKNKGPSLNNMEFARECGVDVQIRLGWWGL